MSAILIMWKINFSSQSPLPQLSNEKNQNRPKADTVTAFLCHSVQTCYSHLAQDITPNPIVLEYHCLTDYIDINYV